MQAGPWEETERRRFERRAGGASTTTTSAPAKGLEGCVKGGREQLKAFSSLAAKAMTPNADMTD